MGMRLYYYTMPTIPRRSPGHVSPGQDKEQPVDDVPEDLQRENTHKGVGLEAKLVTTEVGVIVNVARHGVGAHKPSTSEIFIERD